MSAADQDRVPVEAPATPVPEYAAHVIAYLRGAPRSLSVATALAALASVVAALLGPEAWADAYRWLRASKTWPTLPREQALRVLAAVAKDMETGVHHAFADTRARLDELARALEAAAGPRSMLDAGPPACLAGGVVTRADVAPVAPCGNDLLGGLSAPCSRPIGHAGLHAAGAFSWGAIAPPPRALCEACRTGSAPGPLHTCERRETTPWVRHGTRVVYGDCADGHDREIIVYGPTVEAVAIAEQIMAAHETAAVDERRLLCSTGGPCAHHAAGGVPRDACTGGGL